MRNSKIEAPQITKPGQLMALWLVTLALVNSSLISVTSKIKKPEWFTLSIVSVAIVVVPVFWSGIFMLQVVFCKRLQ
jgi:ABC-type dipeptide/oligopeptide/nickel transport system permease component